MSRNLFSNLIEITKSTIFYKVVQLIKFRNYCTPSSDKKIITQQRKKAQGLGLGLPTLIQVKKA